MNNLIIWCLNTVINYKYYEVKHVGDRLHNCLEVVNNKPTRGFEGQTKGISPRMPQTQGW